MTVLDPVDQRSILLSLDDTFLISGLDGNIISGGDMGLFARDTRYVSKYALSANGQPWIPVASTLTSHCSGRIELTNRHLRGRKHEIPEGTLTLGLSRVIGEGLHEDIEVVNRGDRPLSFALELDIAADFADLFEVKGFLAAPDRCTSTRWVARRGELVTSYRREDFSRQLVYRVEEAGSLPSYGEGGVRFFISLQPGDEWHACTHFLLLGHEPCELPADVQLHTVTTSSAGTRERSWQATTPRLHAANADVQRWFERSVSDIGALRICMPDLPPEEWLPAAGAPWFMALFGRDSLITSLQSMWLTPGLARGALRKLAEYQAVEVDPWRDAEPGKIPHEIRFGELAHFRSVPHTPYYGTADATPLYITTLHEAWKWTGDDGLLHAHRDTALRCLEWIDRYGDRDGDGFQEYATRSPQGYENMAWKDAGDAIVYPDGSHVGQPKALCELQGYVFDAWMRAAELFAALGETAYARELLARAIALQARFEKRFWCEELGCYALALDGDKHPVRSVASNAGHCLWSGIASPEHAARVAERLLAPDMASGWGIRTLSASHPGYDPLSYQRGSVWPHDNGIIILGFKRYGLTAAVARVAGELYAAAGGFADFRLPELFGGQARRPGAAPHPYAGANSPQAWAAGSVLHILQAILGLRGDAPNARLYVDPELPEWLPEVTVRGMHVGQATVELHVWRNGPGTSWDAEVRGGPLAVEKQPWARWLTNDGPAEK